MITQQYEDKISSQISLTFKLFTQIALLSSKWRQTNIRVVFFINLLALTNVIFEYQSTVCKLTTNISSNLGYHNVICKYITQSF